LALERTTELVKQMFAISSSGGPVGRHNSHFRNSNKSL